MIINSQINLKSSSKSKSKSKSNKNSKIQNLIVLGGGMLSMLMTTQISNKYYSSPNKKRSNIVNLLLICRKEVRHKYEKANFVRNNMITSHKNIITTLSTCITHHHHHQRVKFQFIHSLTQHRFKLTNKSHARL